jgi:transposase
LAIRLTEAHRHDVTPRVALVEAMPPVRGTVGRPRRRPASVQGDRAYDSEPHRRQLRAKGIAPVPAHRRTPHGSGWGVFRWVVERTMAWLQQCRRLRIRYARRDDIHEACLHLGCALICWNVLDPSLCERLLG